MLPGKLNSGKAVACLAYQVFIVTAVVIVISALLREVGVVSAGVPVAIVIRRIVIARALDLHIAALRHTVGHGCAHLRVISAILVILPADGVHAETILLIHSTVVGRAHARFEGIVGVREATPTEFDGVQALERGFQLCALLVQTLELGFGISEQLVRGLILGLDGLELGQLGTKDTLGPLVLMILHLGSMKLLALSVRLRLERSCLQGFRGGVELGLVLGLRIGRVPALVSFQQFRSDDLALHIGR